MLDTQIWYRYNPSVDKITDKNLQIFYPQFKN